MGEKRVMQDDLISKKRQKQKLNFNASFPQMMYNNKLQECGSVIFKRSQENKFVAMTDSC